MARKKGRSKKKSGKFIPLIWLLTGALIALSIVYSNTLFKKNSGDNQSTETSTNDSPLSGLSEVADNIISGYNEQRSNRNTSTSTSVQVITPETDMDYRIYLARQSGDTVNLFSMTVDPDETDSILMAVMQELIDFRSPDYLNLIPIGTKINQIRISDRIAYIDFNESFSFNSYGVLGYKIQVAQVVYTATQFASVDAVYFYMEGEPLEYLGGEGYLLHNPIYPMTSLPSFDL